MHDFEAKKAEGERHERTLDRYFSDEYTVMRVNHFGQRAGIDRAFTPRDGGPAFHVEYKADSRADQTNNAFIETESVADERMGWAVTASAAVLIYYIPPRHLAYWVEMPRLRERLPQWREEFPTKGAENRDYVTLGLTVPLGRLAAIASRRLFIPPDDDDNEAGDRLEVRDQEGWRVPLWARGFGQPLPWKALACRLEIAERLRPGLRWRIAEEAR